MSASRYIIVFVLIIAAAVLGYLYWQELNPNQRQSNQTQTQAITGTVVDVAISDSVILIKDQSGDDINLAVTPATILYDNDNHAVGMDFLVKGFTVQATGTQGDNNDFEATEIRTISAPNIIVDTPLPNDVVGENFAVSGRARVFDGSTPLTINPESSRGIENQFGIRVSANGQSIYGAQAVASSAPDAGKFGEFSHQVNLDASKIQGTSTIILDVYDNSPKDGSEIDKVSIPLKFQSNNTVSIKVFFNNSKMDGGNSCDNVYSLTRNMARTPAIGRAALDQLLQGPTDDEKNQGFSTSINTGVQVQSLTIDASSTAYVDFNEFLEQGIAGSCKVSAIRNQINQTLLQFPGIKNVVISINGNSTSTLQP